VDAVFRRVLAGGRISGAVADDEAGDDPVGLQTRQLPLEGDRTGLDLFKKTQLKLIHLSYFSSLVEKLTFSKPVTI